MVLQNNQSACLHLQPIDASSISDVTTLKMELIGATIHWLTWFSRTPMVEGMPRISSFPTQTGTEQVALSSTGLNVALNSSGNTQNTDNINISFGNSSRFCAACQGSPLPPFAAHSPPHSLLSMSDSNSTVGYHIECYSQETGAGWDAVGASTPTTYYGGNNYTFYFVNNTQATDTTTAISFNYDLSSLLPQPATGGATTGGACDGGLVFLTDTSSSVTGTVAPGATVSVSIATGTTDETHNDAAEMSLQSGAASLITNLGEGSYQVCFWLSTDGDGGAVGDQQIAICDTGNGTTLPISSFNTNTSSEQVAESTTAGISVTLNAGGNSLNTNNIYIQIGNS